jgi:protease I|eukprot:4956572-Prymnesium_polylepis.1
MFSPKLKGKRILLFIDFQFEDMEVMWPKMRVSARPRAAVAQAPPALSKNMSATHTHRHIRFRKQLEEEGATVCVCGSHPPNTKYTGKYGYPVMCEEKLDMDELGRIQSAGVDAIVIPGGFAPDYMRRNPAMLKAVTDACANDVPIAAICHGPWVLCSARPQPNGPPVLSGRHATSFSAIKDDVINAGATFVDQPVVIDGPIITSRTPNDLVPWVHAIIEQILKRS